MVLHPPYPHFIRDYVLSDERRSRGVLKYQYRWSEVVNDSWALNELVSHVGDFILEGIPGTRSIWSTPGSLSSSVAPHIQLYIAARSGYFRPGSHPIPAAKDSSGYLQPPIGESVFFDLMGDSEATLQKELSRFRELSARSGTKRHLAGVVTALDPLSREDRSSFSRILSSERIPYLPLLYQSEIST